jgi:hypothetical protein
VVSRRAVQRCSSCVVGCGVEVLKECLDVWLFTVRAATDSTSVVPRVGAQSASARAGGERLGG